METKKIAIGLVLRTGGPTYDYKYVNNLVEGIKRHITVPHRIFCITDDKRGLTQDIDNIIRFHHDWPGWWGKIELFRKDIYQENEQVFYFDLDTFIVGNLDDILTYDGRFCALTDFYRSYALGSGMMSWNASYDMSKIYYTFLAQANKYINNTPEGDQAFIQTINPRFDRFQDIFKDQVISYKVHCLEHKTVKPLLPDNARVICFHGKPRPHEIQNHFSKYWKQ